MESNAEVVTKVNEAESENKPTQAEENQKAVNSSAETNESVGAADENKKEQESKEEVKEEPKETVKEEVKKEVKTEEDENGQTETTTVTIVAKKSDGEGSQSETTTTTTTTVTVVAKKPGDDADADVTDSSANTVETKTETTIVTKSEKSAEAGAATEPTVPDTSVEEVEETVVVEEEEEEAEAEAEEVESTSNQKAVAEPEQAETESEAESESESEEEVEEQPPQAAEQKEAEVPEKVQEEDTEEKPQTKKDFNDQIQDIISDIDSNIKAQEKITQLKEQELQLIQKQQELANQIQQQQILAQKLIAQNQLKEQELQAQQRVQQQLQNQQYQQHQQVYQKPAQPYANVINQQEDYNNVKESTNVSRTVDLRKIFTPATDAPEILPKNRKLYASSAFYSPTLHPTVEDQVELARRISHSLSDISNQKSKGQSMYVNRKKRSVKWVHEGCAQDYQQYQPKPPTSPSIVPAYSDAGKHRVQLNIHQDQLIEKYSKPGVQVVKSPWEAALQTGSASSAFVEESKFPSQTPPAASPSYFNRDYVDLPVAPAPAPAPTTYGSQQDSYKNTYDTSAVTQRSQPLQPVNPQRELAYKPSVAQGWRGPQVELPRGLYVPKEISLASYAPPPVQSPPQVQSPYARAQSPYVPPSNNVGNGYGRPSSYAPSSYEPAGQPSYEPVGQSPYGSGGQSAYGPGGQSAYGPGGQSSGFPLSKPSTGFSSAVPPKQQLYAPSSYQKVPQTSSQNAPPVNFNPSPLSFDKLSKFEQPEQRNVGYQPQRNLNVRGYSKVRNVSPAPFGGARSPIGQGSPISVSPQPHAQQYGGGGYGGYGQSARTASPGQSFNNCARGWGGGSGNAGQRSFLSQRPAVAADSLPYSDF
ncbi:histone-lysine N-methyltransferase 2D isoform X8 [Scaptodrosophila lebanonensis]|uniref:Histone-lysine N-methyltransferase 2D isoform X8 n=1 Tax=Drosophila lebanonensis TaxID=7225 RepID=A0A6J2TS03_DROLE|nr:histone-lysine N-methyltransferase 2D isoform X8 [Scaptodrosophila lebanonensis]